MYFFDLQKPSNCQSYRLQTRNQATFKRIFILTRSLCSWPRLLQLPTRSVETDLRLELSDEVALHLERVDQLADGRVHLGLDLLLAQLNNVVRVQVKALFKLFCAEDRFSIS
jgi:hypothetical protein